MKFNYLVQDELDELEHKEGTDTRKLKDPITITITIEMEKEKYFARKKKYKEHPFDKFIKCFQ